jgi:hypothetical protein
MIMRSILLATASGLLLYSTLSPWVQMRQV